jgi:hypothetical protein
MECSPAELHALSTRLLAHSVELRRAAGFARKRGSDCRESAQAARSRAETCRIHAVAAVSVPRIRPPRPSRLPSANSQWASTAQPDRPLVAFGSEEYRTEPRHMPSLQPHVVSEAVTSVGVEMPSRHADQDVAARLQDLYHKNDIARAVFDNAAERRYVVAKTSVERIARIAGTTRAKAGDLCMLLDTIGVATFKQAKQTGDYKFPTRIHWRYVPRSIGLVAKGTEETLEDIHWDEAGGMTEDAITSNGADHPAASRFIEHQFPLCEGRVATLCLPIDLTKGEVDRLSRFMTALVQPD